MMNWLKFYFNKIIFLKDEKFNTFGQKGIEKESYIGFFSIFVLNVKHNN